MVPPTTAADRAAGPLNLGFLTVLQEVGGYLGGYLVTNHWGRPLEFRLTSAVQPNRVQQVLYGPTLLPYVCADLIGRTLVEKAAVPVRLIVTDREAVLDLRLKLETPVVWLAPADVPLPAGGAVVSPSAEGRGAVCCHPRHPEDAGPVRELLAKMDPAFDFAEPFQRVREAIGEARKLGVAGRAG